MGNLRKEVSFFAEVGIVSEKHGHEGGNRTTGAARLLQISRQQNSRKEHGLDVLKKLQVKKDEDEELTLRSSWKTMKTPLEELLRRI